MSNKKYIIILLMILCLSAISSVSANDLNDNMTLAEDNGIDNSGLIAVEDANQTIDDGANDLVSDDTLSVSLSDDEINANDGAGDLVSNENTLSGDESGNNVLSDDDYFDPSRYNIIANDVTTYYGSNQRFYAKVTSNGFFSQGHTIEFHINGEVIEAEDKIYLDSNFYWQTLPPSIDLNYPAAIYPVICKCGNLETSATVTILPTIVGIDVNGTYKNTKYSVIVLDSYGDRVVDEDVDFEIDSVTSTITTNGNGVATLDVNLPPGTYYVTAKNPVTSEEITNKIVIEKGESTLNLDVPDVTKNYGGPENLEITLTELDSPVANADVNININGRDYTKTTDANGKASLGLNLNAGSYDATVTYKDISTKAKVVINKLTTKNTLSYAKNSHNSVTLTALIDPSTASGDVVFTVNGKDYSAKVNGGKATYTLNNLAVGSYSAVAKYKGDVNHKESSSNSVKFTVEDVKIEVSAPDLTKYYNGPERFVVTVKEDYKAVVGKNVTINLNGRPYIRTTDSDGQASMAINLNSGKYNVTTEYDGIKIYSTITIKDTVISKDFTKIFRNNTQYYATFVDSQGNVLKNTPVRLNINGVYYTRTTSDQGIAKMNINLNPGTYILTAENPASGEQHTTVITVLPSIVENHDLTKYYRNESKYTLRILDGNGKPVNAGVTVKLNINGVFYERKTNASGYINMNINLIPGTYIVTAEYNGLRASNTVKVLPVLSAKDVNMKYRDGTKFEAKLLNGKGNPFANQKITFNINGVFYERITDANGIARLNINLMAGEYIITSMYENGAALANKVTIRS